MTEPRPPAPDPPDPATDQMINDYVEMSGEAAARKHGMSWRTLRKRLVLAGVTIRAPGRRPESERRQLAEVPPDEVAALKRRREAGESLPHLMEGFEGSYRTLRAVLENAGVEPSGPVQPLPTPQALIDAYVAGKSMRESMKIANVASTRTAHRMLKDAGVPLRPPGRPPSSGQPR
jgi:hypothetical protein